MIEPRTVDVKNLSFTSADPEGVIAWKGEENETESLTVHLEDNDLTDPITLSFRFYSTARDNSYGERSCDAAVTRDFPDGLAGGSYTLHLNSSEWNVDPGLYTYEVEAIQTDICNTDPDLQIEDRARYRSEHLSLRRGVDEMGPVYTAEYYGYDDKNTTDEEDDDYLYFIRLYQVSSSNPICGSTGEVWLYDPTLTKVYSCGLGGLECLKHPAPDGLCSGEHAIVIPVPVNKMPPIGSYRFLLHVKDNHGDHYRNGEDRWALDLNATGSLWPIVHFTLGAYHVIWCRAEAMGSISKKLIDVGKTDYPAKKWVQNNTQRGEIRGATNGGLFNRSGVVPIADWSAGTWKDGEPCRTRRWGFSMDENGSSFLIKEMIQKGTMMWNGGRVPRYIAHKDVKVKPYGLANVGLLVSNGVPKSVPTEEEHGGWPAMDNQVPRTVIAW